ncbi:MAG: acyl-ACP--UDP-N-acetylglucosamine O-acyltransferase [Gemmatimonadales bacterium]|jgi:UDP-N-acetylglucosamine acyltransferase|nr:MAG: acyl-ACP--UDP-N-acetylglucosamine O-acyltransferase [Gemmatimonadales bacterium]
MKGTTGGAEGPTETFVHPSALVDDGAELGVGVQVGPFSIVGPGVTLGDGTRLASHVLVARDTTVGADCRISQGAVLGTDPQDLKFQGERTWLEVGDRTVIREYATLNRGTSATGRTVVGSDCLLMAYTHVAHDCVLGNHIVLSNSVNMAGHVVIGDWVIVGGLTPIHQFVRVGAHAFVGGASRIAQDVPPYCRAAGNPSKLYGLNSVGLERRGFGPEVRKALKQAYRLVFKAGLNVSRGVARARDEAPSLPEVGHFLDFIAASERGIIS